MTRLILSLLIGTFLWTGCSSVTFTDPMPLGRRDLDHFPLKWQGNWTDGDELTLEIFPHKVFFESTEETIQLGENAKLRRFHGYLILNQRQDQDSQWSVILGRRWKDEIHLWKFNQDDADAVAVWNEILTAEAIEQVGVLEKQTYVLSPENNAAFRKLLTQGGITDGGTLQRVLTPVLPSH